MTDPFSHHPELRDLIRDPEASDWRHITTPIVRERLAAAGITDFPFNTEAEREAIWQKHLGDHTGPLWVFAYGSLMWDPAFHFDSIRHAHLDGYARRFILYDDQGGRGTKDAPGLMAALDEGGACEGMAFRIPADIVPRESRILFQREVISPGYHPTFVTLDLGDRRVQALTFVADHDSRLMRSDMTRAEQVKFIATGAGILGTSYDYLCSLLDQLAVLDIQDDDLTALRAEVDAFRAH